MGALAPQHLEGRPKHQYGIAGHRTFVLAIAQHRPRVERYSAMPSQPQIHGVISGRIHICGKPADIEDGAAPENRSTGSPGEVVRKPLPVEIYAVNDWLFRVSGRPSMSIE